MFKPSFLVQETIPFSLAKEMKREVVASGMTEEEFLRNAVKFACKHCVHTHSRSTKTSR